MSTDNEHAHAFARDTTSLCRCGMTAGHYQQLLADEAAGRPHAAATTKPVDEFGRVVEVPPKFEIPQEITRSITIDWRSGQIPGLPGHIFTDRVSLTDADTGQPILTATEIHVHSVAGHMVVAELVTLADANGDPILDGEIRDRLAIDTNDNLATTTTWWHVAEMRAGE